MYEKIKHWYPKLWSKKMVADAVKKHVLTADQYKDITEEAYLELD